MFMRDIADHGSPGKEYGDPINFMNRRLQIDQFIVVPFPSCWGRLLAPSAGEASSALLLGLAPVLFVYCRGWGFVDILSDCASLLSGWAGSQSGRNHSRQTCKVRR
jgi:hypothetical protein